MEDETLENEPTLIIHFGVPTSIKSTSLRCSCCIHCEDITDKLNTSRGPKRKIGRCLKAPPSISKEDTLVWSDDCYCGEFKLVEKPRRMLTDREREAWFRNVGAAGKCDPSRDKMDPPKYW